MEKDGLLGEMGDFIGTVLDEEWEWTHTRRGGPPSICIAGGCTWGGSDDHEPGCPISRMREVLRLSRIALRARLEKLHVREQSDENNA